VQLESFFKFSPDWYREGEVRSTVLSYYQVLRRVLREHPHLRRCLTRCVHCRIYFITHPRNCKRTDIRCPYGCRQSHRKASSTRRSVAYYQTKEGKIKKRIQNSKRSRKVISEKVQTNVENPRIDETTVGYLLMITRFIEGRRVTLDELLHLVFSFLRQHSMDRYKKAFYPLENSRGDP